MLPEDREDTTMSATLHFFAEGDDKGNRNAPLFLREKTCEDVIFTNAKISRKFISEVGGVKDPKFGLKDKIKWRERVKSDRKSKTPSESQHTVIIPDFGESNDYEPEDIGLQRERTFDSQIAELPVLDGRKSGLISRENTEEIMASRKSRASTRTAVSTAMPEISTKDERAQTGKKSTASSGTKSRVRLEDVNKKSAGTKSRGKDSTTGKLKDLKARVEANSDYLEQVQTIMDSIDGENKDKSTSKSARPKTKQSTTSQVRFSNMPPVEQSPSHSVLDNVGMLEAEDILPRATSELDYSQYSVNLDSDSDDGNERLETPSELYKPDDDDIVPPPAYYSTDAKETVPVIRKSKTTVGFGGARPKKQRSRTENARQKVLQEDDAPKKRERTSTKPRRNPYMTRERRRMIRTRKEKWRTLQEIYGTPQIIVGTYGGHPEPRPIFHKKEPSEKVKKSAQHFMGTLLAYRQMRQKFDEEQLKKFMKLKLKKKKTT